MAAPLNTCTTTEDRGVVRFLWAKNMDAAKDIHKKCCPYGPVTTCVCKPEAAKTVTAHDDEQCVARNMLSL
jgi:hypothetical protein